MNAHSIRKTTALPTATPALEGDVRFFNDKLYVCDGAAWNELSTGGGGGGDDSGPKVYRALLSQSGTDAPVATVLENTLGGTPVWSRDGIGVYRAVLAGVFLESKVFILSIPDGYSGSSAVLAGGRVDDNILEFASYFGDAEQDLDSGSGVGAFVEILVYP